MKISLSTECLRFTCHNHINRHRKSLAPKIYKYQRRYKKRSNPDHVHQKNMGQNHEASLLNIITNSKTTLINNILYL